MPKKGSWVFYLKTMKRIFSRKTRIIASTALTIFSLGGVALGSFAWFVSTLKLSESANYMPVINSISSALSISLHEYYGETNNHVWGFNPTPDAIVDFDANENNSFAFDMEKYSIEDQDHPILFLIEVNGDYEIIKAFTECCFLADNPAEIKATFKNYSSVSGAGLSNGDYIIVNEDENYDSTNKPTTLRKYNGTSFTGVTYATKTALRAALAADTSHTTFTDGACFGVVSDNEHNNSTTVYKYNLASNELSMIWFKLEENKNPLSSAVRFNSLTFVYNPKTENLGTYDFDEDGNSEQYMPVATSSLDDEKSFATISNNGTASFEKNVTLFEGDVSSDKYIGIIMNYNPSSIEYIYSYYMGHPLLNEDISFTCDWSMSV